MRIKDLALTTNVGGGDVVVLDQGTAAPVTRRAPISAILSAPLFTQAGTGAVSRSVNSKLADVFSFQDYGAVGDDASDDTAEMQAAIDAVAALGGGVLNGTPGCTYRISAPLVLKSSVRIDLAGAVVKQYTSNTPIFTAPSTADIQGWGLCNGTLRFATQQTSVNTSGVGVRLANTKNSYNWVIRDLQVRGACDGIFCGIASGTFAFVGEITNFIGNECAAWAINIACDTVAGANTNIVCTNCWSLQTAGSEIATSKGFRFVACAMSQWNSLYADHIQGQFVYFESCSGKWGVLTLESADITAAGTQIALAVFADTSGRVDALKFVVNNFAASGGGEIYLLRTTANISSAMNVETFLTSGNVYTGGGSIYEVNPQSTTKVFNLTAELDRSVNLADGGVVKLIKMWNGVDRSISRGTTAQRPTLTADAIGKMYLDNTLDADGKPIFWNGTAWIDATGAVV